jgi:hypothetical protein
VPACLLPVLYVCKQGKDASGMLTRARGIAICNKFAQACATAAPASRLHSPLLIFANCQSHVRLREPSEGERNVEKGIIVENVDKWTMSTVVSRPFFTRNAVIEGAYLGRRSCWKSFIMTRSILTLSRWKINIDKCQE